MALQTSGAISLSDIQTEFGGSNPISLSEYYGAAAGIPASGAISISDFYGAAAYIEITVTQANYNNTYYGRFTNGSVSPTSLLGYNIRYLFRNSASSSVFWLYLDGTVPDNLFTSVDVETSAGFTNLLESAALTGQSGAGYRYWAWQQADFASTTDFNNFVAAWDGTGDVRVRFYE